MTWALDRQHFSRFSLAAVILVALLASACSTPPDQAADQAVAEQRAEEAVAAAAQASTLERNTGGSDPEDEYSIKFESNGRSVVAMHAGHQDWISRVSGCF